MADQLFAPTLEEQIQCIEREIAMRERVYPGWVLAKRMTQAKADREIATMKAASQSLIGLLAARQGKAPT